MTRLVWYAHHAGSGHASRALAFAEASPVPVTIVSELDLADRWSDVVRLPPDAPDGMGGDLTSSPPEVGAPGRSAPGGGREAGDPTAGGWLHWAPRRPDLLGPRTARLVELLTAPDVVGLVTDVSVEAGLTARLCGVPVVAVHELGVRDDRPHRLGRACAEGLLAPYPAALADPAVDPTEPELFHAGFVARRTDPGPGGRADARLRLGLDDGPVVLVALGGGAHGARRADLDRLAVELRDARVVVVGRATDDPGATAYTDLPDEGRARVDGWVGSLADHLAAADVVVATAGASLVAEVAAARRPLVCVPEPRPFAEQCERARRLVAADVAACVPRWSDTAALGAAVAGALGDPTDRWDRIDHGPGAARAVDWVLDRLDAPTRGLR